ncbi:hypothetical protein [Breoghania sp.]|uniref:hypothetical protein n=1 Tax=Breoghania sp. TaxID=2065378 RepID=UPI002635CA9C|nr:hypothetical protein [Breoghania sp.]MDJ0932199.1 hypothetical protein [Breoghania sp.]
MDPTAGVADLDLLDLRTASEDDMECVAAFARAVKALFARLEDRQLSDTMALSDTTSEAAPMGHEEMARLSGVIAHNVIRSANRD